MKILITGAAGFIGSHFDAHLDDDHNTISRVEIYPTNGDPAVDVRDFFRYNDETYDLVIHCAAMVGGRAKIDGDPLAIAQNLAIDSDMFRWALRTKPGRIVYFSSSAAYPTFLQTREHNRLLDEDLISAGWLSNFGSPDQTYGWAKLTGELLARQAEAEGLRVHVFRPFSGYGTDQSLDYPFPAFIERAQRKVDPFQIWGDGQQCRDWIHVDDIVGAVMAAIKQDVQGPVNLCTGIPTTFDELAALVTTQAGYHPELQHLPHRPTGVYHRVGDATKMETFYTHTIALAVGVQRALARR